MAQQHAGGAAARLLPRDGPGPDLEVGVSPPTPVGKASAPRACTCFICHVDEEETAQPLLTDICACVSLSMHAECLQQLLNSSAKREGSERERFMCAICREPYRIDFEPGHASRGGTPREALRHICATFLVASYRCVLVLSFVAQFAAAIYLGVEHAHSSRSATQIGALYAEAIIALAVVFQAVSTFCCALPIAAHTRAAAVGRVRPARVQVRTRVKGASDGQRWQAGTPSVPVAANAVCVSALAGLEKSQYGRDRVMTSGRRRR